MHPLTYYGLRALILAPFAFVIYHALTRERDTALRRLGKVEKEIGKLRHLL